MGPNLSRITVGFDMSLASRAALEAAAWFGEPLQACIQVVTATPGLGNSGNAEQWGKKNEAPPNGDHGCNGADSPTELQNVIRAAVDELNTRGVPVEIVLGKKRASRTIVDSAEAFGAQMTVVGARSRQGAHPRDRLGATAERVVRRSPVSVLVVTARRPSFPPRRVLCAVDASETSQRAFEWAVWLGQLVHAKIIALHVVPRPEHNRLFSWTSPEKHRPTAQDSTQATMDGFLKKFDLRGLDVSGWVLYGAPDHQILNFLEDEQVDLLTIGTNGTGAIDQMALGATAQRVIRAAPCSVLAVKPDRPSHRAATFHV